MLVQTEAQIYLANQRGNSYSDGFRSFHTLNFGNYLAEGRASFGRLLAFNDEALAAGKRTVITSSKPVEIILLPITGGLELIDRYGESIFVSSGEAFRFLAFPESSFTVFNPYPKETINYLQIQLIPDLSSDAIDNHFDETPHVQFSLEGKNNLVPVFSGIGQKVSGFMGKYGGREEEEFKPSNPYAGIFTYIIQGAFEVQNRLLEKGDALSLTNVETLEFEALSEDGIILVMEVGHTL
ncbi:pirin family protein [Dyadobacter psychrotolerans]|uniref:Quercetin 2,3-dioxygenase C-terminal cupin domain-containing protein n=1 Tax=Dyadobacter psychrotolerans TaxID=2541721 RepID=A0A4R5DA49_9BACT|nr:hypothetical protein [Dyadobacter psychrotolerans]TDE08830.1 hypothetical protein E0F88_31780 [Dyadobacter psychrotolerans]